MVNYFYVMSNLNNIRWLEAAKENFDVALEEGDYPFARAVIEDIKDRGFGAEAKTLLDALLEKKVSTFVNYGNN